MEKIELNKLISLIKQEEVLKAINLFQVLIR